uniref:Uncharacterized protein n=1 Tax=Rhizophora mucronata TaxID=61149 RepID=A0A2P2Q5P8_RHIMU
MFFCNAYAQIFKLIFARNALMRQLLEREKKKKEPTRVLWCGNNILTLICFTILSHNLACILPRLQITNH